MSVLIIGDSRLSSLVHTMDSPLYTLHRVICLPGGTIDTASRALLAELHQHRSIKLVIISIGINEVTTKVGPHKCQVSSLDHDWKTCKMVSSLQYLVWRVSELYPSVVTIPCPLYGMDLNVYSSHLHPPNHQEYINLVVGSFNDYIRAFNKSGGWKAPDLHKLIHHYHSDRKEWSHAYGMLHDGLHPRSTLVRQIREQLTEHILLNLAVMSSPSVRHTTANRMI